MTPRQAGPRGQRPSAGAAAPSHRAARQRCAIYTRKSSEEGLDQDFNSLQAQREACEAYVLSQRHEGWQLIPDAYDDGGYSGGSMDRPGLERLLGDVESGRIDIVVVYKVDRLTRSLADFARIVDVFDAKGVSFVSVTQSFNTTTSMGRLTLNVLLSFAQFEREVTAERIRDKIAASKKKGIWMGGNVPFGYRVLNRRLIVDEEVAATVRLIFDLYRSTLSTIATTVELRRRGIVTRKRPRAGRMVGGIQFGRGGIAQMLRNRIYIGDIQQKGVWNRGEHPAIIDASLFDEVQTALSAQRSGGCRKQGATSSGRSLLLTGRLFDSAGNRMSPSHTSKKGVRYPYYVSRALLDGEPAKAGMPSRVPAQKLEAIVTDALRRAVAAEQDNGIGAELDGRQPATASGAWSSTVQTEARDAVTLVEDHLDRVELFRDHIVLHITSGREQHASERISSWMGQDTDSDYAVKRSPEPGDDGDRQPSSGPQSSGDDATQQICTRRIIIPCDLTARRPVRDLVRKAEPNASSSALTGLQAGNHRRLLQAIQRARHWHQQLLSGSAPDIRAIAAAEQRSERNIRTFINLAFLSPTIVQAAVEGRIDRALGATAIAHDLPLEWHEQDRRILGRHNNQGRKSSCALAD